MRCSIIKPNILLIQTDQQTAGTLGLYGNPLVETPNLEHLAENGVVFDNAFCNYPACSPSRSSMMTGRYASTINVHANHMIANPLETTFPEALKAGGYQTVLIGKNHAHMDGKKKNLYPHEKGDSHKPDVLHEAFDYVREAVHGHLVDGYREDPDVQAAHQWTRDHAWKSPLGHGKNPASYEKCGTYLLSETAVDYLQNVRKKDQPFFMWLSFPDPHTPYQAPEPYASMYKPEEVPMPPKDDLTTKPERVRVANIMDALDIADEEIIREIRAIHYGMINFIDDAVGRVLDTLEKLDMKENTVVMFTSDHGDSMGAHGVIQKQNFFYDSFTHVPFIISWPEHIESNRCGNLVELVDVMPTLLELACCEIPFGVQGKSLAPYLQGKEYYPREFAVIESGESGEPLHLSEITVRPESPYDENCFPWCAWREAWLGKGKCIRTHNWKLSVYANGEGELYDLDNDPDELNNLFGDNEYKNIVQDLEYKLLLWTMENEDKIPENTTVGLNYRDR